MDVESIIFLTVEEVIELHAVQLKLYGGSSGIRDRASLESAVGMPQAAFGGEYLHVGLFEMAAAYAFHVAENQPFVDGNKRAALDAALTFLAVNGQRRGDPEGRLYKAMIAISARKLDKPGLAKVLESLGGV